MLENIELFLVDLLEKNNVKYTVENFSAGRKLYCLEGKSLAIMPIPLSVFFRPTLSLPLSDQLPEITQELNKWSTELTNEIESWRDRNLECEKIIYLYEDTILKDKEGVECRLKCHFDRGEKFFAKYCQVRKISRDVALEFFANTHSYGAVSAKHYYGLYKKRSVAKLSDDLQVGELLAVCSFSAARVMKYEDGRKSYQWVNYAALPSLRVVGGMGKLLNAFIRDFNPDDIVTYGDREWSQGDVYEKLGFEKIGEREPILFNLSTGDYLRVPLQAKLKEQEQGICKNESIIISNLGSLKYRLSKLI